MKTIKEIYESIILENLKDDAIAKFGTESTEYVNKFWNDIRTKETDVNKKDILYWLKQDFSEFKDYIDNFKTGKTIKKSEYFKTDVDNGAGKLLKNIDGYEVWQVDSYNASRILGRTYKNQPTHWCISSNTNEHWVFHYRKEDARFFFIIKEEQRTDPENKIWDKVAIKIWPDNTTEYWDLDDNESVEKDARNINELPKNLQKIIKQLNLKWYRANIKYSIYDYVDSELITYEEDGSINVEGNVEIQNELFEKLPFKFNRINGYFDISSNKKLTTLEGCPKIVNGEFRVNYCISLLSLEGGPNIVMGDYLCTGCHSLKSLKGAPEKIDDGIFSISHCLSLRSLEGSPKEINGDFLARNCASLETLNGGPIRVTRLFRVATCLALKSLQGGPKIVMGNYECDNNISLKTLEGAPEKVFGHFETVDCLNLESLKGCPKMIGKTLDTSGCSKIKSLEGVGQVGSEVLFDNFSTEDYNKYAIEHGMKPI